MSEISSNQKDVARYRSMVASAQIKELSEITYKQEHKIRQALAALSEQHPEDDILSVAERIIIFLRLLG
jgi:hypothetical protein